MKKYFFGANWKMNMSVKQADLFFKEWDSLSIPSSCDIVFFPTQYLLGYMQHHYGQKYLFGAQNVSHLSRGALTGEISADLLKEDGIFNVLIGHSERRTMMREHSQEVNQKVKKSQEEGLRVVLCIGEPLSVRELNVQETYLKDQLDTSLESITPKDIVIAYEPIWSIGTGKIPALKEIQEAHTFIFKELTKLGYSENNITLIYGGSVNASNASDILSLPFVNGVLVGGASLKPKDFYDIVTKAPY